MWVAIANKRLDICKAGIPVKEQRAGQYALFESGKSAQSASKSEV